MLFIFSYVGLSLDEIAEVFGLEVNLFFNFGLCFILVRFFFSIRTSNQES